MRPTILLLAATCLSAPAHADDPALAQSIYGALRLMTGSGGKQEVTATRDGDAVSLVVRSDQVQVGEPPQKLLVTWTLRAQPDGTYAIEGVSVPSPVIVRREGMDAAKKVPQTTTVSVTIPSIVASGTIDPSLKIAQSYKAATQGVSGVVDIAEETGGSHLPMTLAEAHSAVHMEPVAGGLTDITRDFGLSGLKLDGTSPQGPVSVGLASLDGGSATHGANPAAALDATQAFADQLAVAQKPDGSPDLAKLGPGAFKNLATMLGSGGQSGDGHFTFTDMTVAANAQTVALHEMGLKFAYDGPAEAKKGFMELTLAGPQVPVPTQYTAFVPQTIVLRPGLRGVDGVKLTHTLDLLSAEPMDMQAVQQSLLDMTETPGAAFEIEALHVDMKDTVLDAHGQVRRVAATPVPAAADVEVRVTGLDALIAKMNALPEAQQVLPALIYAKGLAKQDGAALVWQVHAEGVTVTVNGVSVLPSGATRPQPPQKK